MFNLKSGLLLAGTGLLSVVLFAPMNSAQAKEPVKASIAENANLNGHYEDRDETETRTDENGVEIKVVVKRRVYVDDDVRVGVGVDFGDTGIRSDGTFAFLGMHLGEPVDPNHNYHNYVERNGSNYQKRMSRIDEYQPYGSTYYYQTSYHHHHHHIND